MPKFSIIIPAYNEEERIGRTLIEYLEFFKGKLDFEIYVIDDASEDGTLEAVAKTAEEYQQVRFKSNKKRLGKGGSIIEGFKLVEGDLISYIDADGSTPPPSLYGLVNQLGNHDVIMGSRWMKGSKILTPQPWSRRIASRGFNILVRLILNLQYTDTQCPGKVFKKEVIQDVAPDLTIRDFAFDACMLYVIKRKGYLIKEVPIVWKDYTGSSLRIRKHAFGMLKSIIKERMKYTILKRFSR